MLASDAEATLAQILDLLLDAHGISVGAIYKNPGLEPLVERNTEGALTREIAATVRARRLELENGLAVTVRDEILVPAAKDGHVLGLIYLRTDAVDQGLMSEAARAVTAALGASEELDRVRAVNLPRDAERDYLLQRLELHEWNIARVAREVGVTRTTVYARMRRLNIPREKIPKSRRARTQ
jgi:DNA-binding NtrC family response regulator